MDSLLFEVSFQDAKQVDRHEFLISKEWCARIVAPALILERRMFIVGRANPHIQLNELNFWFHNPTLQRLLGLHLYP